MSALSPSPAPPEATVKWYHGVTPYEWLVLLIASVGWIFDAFEGQIFNLTRGDMLADLLHVASNDALVKAWGDRFLGIFLVGGWFGGVVFGSLGDRWGRNPTMILTILFYSVFAGLTAFATQLWQVAALRFLVAMGVGGEWAVAAALVAEVFPKNARAHASGIFHASSVLGTPLAAQTAIMVGSSWRYAYLVGLVPALLTLWVRMKVKEPAKWKEAASTHGKDLGSYRALLSDPRWRKRAILGMLLAAVGLGTFWGVLIAGQDLTKELLQRLHASPEEASSKAKFAYGYIQAIGGAFGLLSFGPLCVRLGRKWTFVLMQTMALVMTPIVCYLPQSYAQMLCVLPVFGFFILGIHAGYAIYFPELFPSHLRATGASFCFNGGRLLAAPVLFFSGALKGLPGMDLRLAVTLLATLFLLGIGLVLFLPETKGQPLPE